ncbi:MAG: hypothetical protein NTV73_12745 [Hyphomicrobiales bacterium]|nr:hypothetical protein [Hyphomicrobiales bacterium]
MAGLVGGPEERAEGEPRRTLPRYLHRAILRLLRPAESAARRLAVALAHSLPPPPALSPRKARAAPTPRPRSLLVRAGVGTGIVIRRDAPPPAGLAHLVPAKPASRSFPLVDPLPRWRISRHWRRAAGIPRISAPGLAQRSAVADCWPPSSDDQLDAIHIDRRLTALACVLDDLPGLARRFLRWRERRDRAVAAGRIHRITVLRGGRPPGGRLVRYDPDALHRRNIREVDEILAYANSLARYALERAGLARPQLARPQLAPDTS